MKKGSNKMVMTMEKDEQKRSKPLKRPGTDGLQFEGFAPVLTGEMTMQLSPLYLREIGGYTFLRKLQEKSLDARDIDNAVEFLIEHHVQPTKENVFRLWMSARLDLLLEAKQPGWIERLSQHGRQE